MELHIWRHLIQILTYRKDLICVIKHFMENLTNNQKNEKYNINDEKYIPYLQSLSDFHIEILHECEILNEERYKSLISYKNKSSVSQKSPIEEIIERDNIEELQKTIRENNIETINTIKEPFNENKNMKIPIIIYSIIHKANKCFKYLLINGIDDPTKTMDDLSLDYFYDSNYQRKEIKNYKWDCMAMAIYCGEVEIITILEENGFEKGNQLAHIEAAILSYRNSFVKQIISKEEEEQVFNEILVTGLFAAVKNNNIRGIELLIPKKENLNITNLKKKQLLHIAAENNSKESGEILISRGADINAKDIIDQNLKNYF